MRYQYTSSGYTNSLKDNWNSGVNVLLIVNILIFILLNWIVLNLNQSNYTVYKILFNNLSLIPQNILITPEVEKFQIWQCLTYLFLHGSFMHLFFNMLGLWFLGRDLENIWGKDKFLKYYFIVGIGSGLLTVLYNIQFVNSYDIRPVVGASGAI